MDSTAPQQQRLLIVDDSKVVRVTARKILRDHFETVEAVDGENAWDILGGEETFALVISDLSMPKLDGYGLLERIRNSHLPHIRDLPVIIITGANDSEASKKRATRAGATDFIGKPFDSVHLLARAQAHASAHSTARTLKEENHALEEESSIDPLTRLGNEMAIMELGYQQLAYAVRHNTRLSVFHVEIDHYGDHYKAHDATVSESIIQTVSTILATTIRHEDTAARIGTARFALLLPGLNNIGIHNLANRIRKSISEHVLKHGNMRIHITVSIGIAAPEIRRNTRFDDLVSLAKSRLAAAIARGGDTVVYDGDEQQPQPRPSGIPAVAAAPAESRSEPVTQTSDRPARIEATTAQQPTMECRSTVTPAPSLDTAAIARGQTGSKHASPGAGEDIHASLNVPDLSRVADMPGFNSGIFPPGTNTDDEVIEITADSNPFMPQYRDNARIDSATGPKQSVKGRTLKKKAATRTARVGLPGRLLAKLFALFKRTGKAD